MAADHFQGIAHGGQVVRRIPARQQLHIIQQAAIVGPQIAATFVGAHAGNDDVVLGQIAPRHLIRFDVIQLRT